VFASPALNKLLADSSARREVQNVVARMNNAITATPTQIITGYAIKADNVRRPTEAVQYNPAPMNRMQAVTPSRAELTPSVPSASGEEGMEVDIRRGLPELVGSKRGKLMG
jgi:hypothetical protein